MSAVWSLDPSSTTRTSAANCSRADRTTAATVASSFSAGMTTSSSDRTPRLSGYPSRPVESVTVVIVAYGAEDWLERAVDAVLDSEGVDLDVVLVDNGCTDGATSRLSGREGVTVLTPGENLGFSGGCNLGVSHSRGRMVALVNGDAVVTRGALAALVEAAARPEVGIATASVRLADREALLNSAGNAIHFTGFSWSGCFEEPAAAHDVERDAFAASGAAMVLRRETWDALGGLDDAYFAYYEDAELSVRCWQRGLTVRYVPGAVVVHKYEFSRHTRKLYLAERNRLLMVLTCFSARLLWLVAPALLVVELAMTVTAATQGWLRQKVAGWVWLWRHRRHLVQRRHELQQLRTVPDRELVPLFAEHLDPGNVPPPAWAKPFDGALRAYWLLVRRFV